MSLIFVFTRSRAYGWRYVCEKPGRPPLRSGGRPTSASLRWPVFHQASRKKRIKFSFGTWPSLFFSLSIVRLTHRYLDRSSEPNFIFNADMSQHRSARHIALIERPKDIESFTTWVSSNSSRKGVVMLNNAVKAAIPIRLARLNHRLT